MDISVIIVNYNVKEFLQNLIPSIYKSAGNLSFEITVVDNASSDGSIEYITKKFPEVKLIANEKNIGFGAANNLAMKRHRVSLFLFSIPTRLSVKILLSG